MDRYYYLGNIEKSKYYQSRVLNGNYEPKDSVVRAIYSSIGRRVNNISLSDRRKPIQYTIIFEQTEEAKNNKNKVNP